MARILNGHFGSYQGKLGAVTGFKRKGIFYIRQSITHNGSNTKLQAAQRDLFGAVAKLFGSFAQVSKIGFANGGGNGLTDHNAFVKFNFDKVNPETHAIDYAKLMVARGSGRNVTAPAVDNPDPGKLRMTWTDNSDTDPMEDAKDTVYLVLTEEQSGMVTVQSTTRGTKKIECGYPRQWSGKQAYAYAFTVAKTNGKISDSFYMGAVQCE